MNNLFESKNKEELLRAEKSYHFMLLMLKLLAKKKARQINQKPKNIYNN